MSKYGSIDVRLTLSAFDSGEWVGLKTNVKLSEDASDTDIVVRVYSDGIWIVSEPSGTVLEKISTDAVLPDIGALFDPDFLPLFELTPEYTATNGLSLATGESIRILFENNTISIYRNEDYFHTFYLSSIFYPENDDPDVYLICSSGWAVFPTLEVLLAELSDWRESIYIESDSVAMSGASDLIQERPVIILARPDGTIDFFYDQSSNTEYSVHDNIIHEHAMDEVDVAAAVEAVVEGRELMAISLPEYAEEIGYQFGTVHLNSLDSGEKKAARVLLRRAVESGVHHSLRIRPDIRIEPDDLIAISPAVSGTGTILDHSIVVEEIFISINNEEATMSLEGRRKL
jgi:hypothetical protein